MMYVLRMSVTPETQPPPVDVHEQRFLLPGEVLPGNGVDPLPLLRAVRHFVAVFELFGHLPVQDGPGQALREVVPALSEHAAQVSFCIHILLPFRDVCFVSAPL